MLRGNQRGIIIFYASSFACLVPDIGSQRECFLWAQTHTHTHAPLLLIKLHLQLVY